MNPYQKMLDGWRRFWRRIRDRHKRVKFFCIFVTTLPKFIKIILTHKKGLEITISYKEHDQWEQPVHIYLHGDDCQIIKGNDQHKMMTRQNAEDIAGNLCLQYIRGVIDKQTKGVKLNVKRVNPDKFVSTNFVELI